MRKDIEKYPEIKFLTMPKWATPVALFVAVAMIGFSVYQNREKFAFGRIFPFLGAEAQSTQDTSDYPNPNKFGVNAAVQTYVLTDDVVKNAAALSGPGATIVGIIQGTDDGWVGTTKNFLTSCKTYCLTPILRLDINTGATAESWGPFFQQVFEGLDYDNTKLVISIGNEVNFKFEWSGGWDMGNPGQEYAKYLRDSISAIRPNVGNAKIIGAPLNTSAPAPGNAEYIYWETFVDQMNEVGGWKNDPPVGVDGHASNPYPVGGLGAYLYKKEMEKFGYTKPVYILETGNNSGVGTASPGEFMDKYWSVDNVTDYCDDASIAAVNFFNATGANPDPRWTKDNKFVFNCGELEDRNLECPVASPEIRYSDYSQCEIVPRSKYKAGVGADSAFSGCITNQLTTLLPEEVNYSVKTNEGLLLKNGHGKAIGRMSIDNVTVTSFIQTTTIENSTGLPMISQAAEFEEDLKTNFNYNIKSSYPADGRFDSSVGVAVESWLNESCKNGNEHNQKASSMGISSDLWPYQEINTSWQCGDGNGFTFTQYAEYRDPPVKKASYVYFPLGTALGATYVNPFIYFDWFTAADDFKLKDETIPDFVGGQSAHILYNPTAMESILSALRSKFAGILSKLGLNTEVSNNVSGVDLTTPEGLKVTGYYTEQKSSGESGVDIGEFEYNQDCGALEDLVVEYNKHVIPGLEAKSGCSLPPTCFDSFGNYTFAPECSNSYCTANADIQKLVQQAKGARDTVAALASQCKGENKNLTGLKMDGSLSLSAPFIPILASERLEDVIWSRDTVCTDAEDNLYAAKVDATIKWYDVNRMEEDKVMGCDAEDNLLRNGDFEETTACGTLFYYRTPLGSCGTGNSEYGGSANASAPEVPAYWDFLWRKDSITEGGPDFKNAPEFQVAHQMPDPRRVLTGERSSKWFSSYASHDVLMYQQATVPSGQPIVFNAYGQMWRGTAESGYDGNSCVKSETASSGSYVRACIIDSNKVIIPTERFINNAAYSAFLDTLENKGGACSSKAHDNDVWNQLSVSYTSQTGNVYVFLQGYAQDPVRNPDDYFDNACLVPAGTLKEVPEAISTWKPERTSGGECSLYNVVTNDCAEKLSASNYSADALILEEKTNFYIPGLGAIPSMRERVSVGIAKSPDTTSDGKAKGGGLYSEIDMHYCKDRSDEEAESFHQYNKAYSTLDIYIIQNLQPTSLARKWAKAIAPYVSDEDIEEILAGSGDYCGIGGGSSSGGGTSGGGGTPADGENFDREPTENENNIIKICEANRYTKEQCAYTLGTAMFESGVVLKPEGGCDCNSTKDYNDDGIADSCTPLKRSDGSVYNYRQYGNKDFYTGQCYFGRGYIQLTHDYNYRNVGLDIGEDLMNNPDLVLDPVIGAKVIVSYFNRRGIGEKIQSSDNFIEARRMVNGDTEDLCKTGNCRDKSKTVGENVAGIALSYLNGTIMDNYVEY